MRVQWVCVVASHDPSFRSVHSSGDVRLQNPVVIPSSLCREVEQRFTREGRKRSRGTDSGSLGAWANSSLPLLKERHPCKPSSAPRAEWPLACRLTAQPRPVGWSCLKRGWLPSRFLGTK